MSVALTQSTTRARGPRITVVGAGAFGGWTALRLLETRAAVTLVDAWAGERPRQLGRRDARDPCCLRDASNVWIAGGGSGHGFKMGPAVGELLADAVLGRRQLDVPEWSLARFRAGIRQEEKWV